MPKPYVFLILFASAYLIDLNYSANVLCMFTSPRKSQLIVFMAVANSLIDRGHNLTVITTIPIVQQFRSKQPFHHILLQPPEEEMNNLYDHFAKMSNSSNSKISAMFSFMTIIKELSVIQVLALQQDQFKNFFNDQGNQFDLMILGYFHNDFLVGVAAKFRCPVAVVTLGVPYGPINRMVGNPDETSYVPFPLFEKNQPMTFFARMRNFASAIVEPLLLISTNWLMESVYKSLFTDEFYPTYHELITNISLVLCNSHFSRTSIRPLVPAIVEIGGIQFNDQPDPLPKYIQEFIASGEHGAIFFSVGSEARKTYLPPEKEMICFKVLSELQQKIIWDWDSAKPPLDSYLNIRFVKWLPYENILVNPNITLLITDGRPNALMAAQYHGTPILGIPLSGDEHYGLQEIVNEDTGIKIELADITEESLRAALLQILGNQFYARKAKDYASVFRDRPVTAKDTAAFWLEYVIRYRGAPHIQSPLVHMTFLERWYIDVIAMILLGLYVAISLVNTIVKVARMYVNKCFGR